VFPPFPVENGGSSGATARASRRQDTGGGRVESVTSPWPDGVHRAPDHAATPPVAEDLQNQGEARDETMKPKISRGTSASIAPTSKACSAGQVRDLVFR
jgi:hypothetical protein